MHLPTVFIVSLTFLAVFANCLIFYRLRCAFRSDPDEQDDEAGTELARSRTYWPPSYWGRAE